jgi:hypothetical protein
MSGVTPFAVINTNNSGIADVQFGQSGLDFYSGLSVIVNGGAATPAPNLTIIYE